ncbi:MAG: hypothetical protein KKC19_03870 [Nanoarchaeota archaeon]|nr:hypothetical protein [Nanoarchaeota archaeon]
MKLKEEIVKAIIELRKDKERKFDQTVDFIINLKKFDLKKDAINLIVNLPFKIKDKKVCAFLEVKNKDIDTITPEQFKTYSEKTALKKLVKKYDFFIAQANLMPKVATTFGRFLGPAGKMPSPQLGIIMKVDKGEIDKVMAKINNSTKVRTKESSIKLAVGKQNMRDEEIAENAINVYDTILKVLPRDKENIKNIELKFTMTKPQKIVIE